MAKGDLSGQVLLFADVDEPAGVGAYGQVVVGKEEALESYAYDPRDGRFDARFEAEIALATCPADDFIIPPVTRPEERPKAPPKPRKRVRKTSAVSFIEVSEDEIGENGRIEAVSEDVLDDVLAVEPEAAQPAEMISAALRPIVGSLPPGPPWREAFERAWAFNFAALTAMSRAIKFIEAGQYPTAKVVLEVAMDDLRGQRPEERRDVAGKADGGS